MTASALSCLFLILPLQAEENSAPAAVEPGKRVLSEELTGALRRIEWEFASAESGRRMIAVTEDVPIEEIRGMHGLAVQWRRGTPAVIAVDKDRSARLQLLDFELLFFTARWLASAGAEIDLVDVHRAARMAALQYAFEKAAAREEFKKGLEAATKRQRESLAARRASRENAASLGETAQSLLFPGRRPREALDALAFDILLYSEDPFFFFQSLLEDEGSPSPAVSLDEIEDFLSLHGSNLAAVEFKAGGSVALAGGHAYSGAVARAALFAKDRVGIARLKEKIGPYRGQGERELRSQVNAWLRAAP